MAIVGGWNTLADAQLLTQSVLLQGLIEEVVEEGQLLPLFPVKQIRGKSLLYNREVTWTPSSGAAFFNIHQKLDWVSDIEVKQIEVTLKRLARQSPLDNFVAATYNNINDYRAVLLSQIRKRVMRFTEDKAIYGDSVNVDAIEFDGLHFLAAGNTGDGNIDQAQGALSLQNLRKIIDYTKPSSKGKDNLLLIFPKELGRRLDAGYQESGFVRSSVTHSLGQVMINGNEIGGRVTLFDGIPILRSDFLVAEEANTGLDQTSSRDKNSTGTKQFSILLVRLGHVEDTGVELLFGATDVGDGEFKPLMHESFDKLENYDAGGERLVMYPALAMGSTLDIARIADITDAEIIP